MTIDYLSAYDEIFQHLKDILDDGATAIIGYVPEVRWEGVEQRFSPDTSKHWIMASQKEIFNQQITFANSDGKRRYQANGLVFVNIFAPVSQEGRTLADLIRRGFRGHTVSDNVWFRNANIKTIESEDGAFRFNVVVEYEYCEVT